MSCHSKTGLSRNAGMSFIALIFLMVFAAWSVAAVITLMSPANRVGGDERTQRQFKTLQAAIARYVSHSGGTWPTGLNSLIVDAERVGACRMDTDRNSPTFRQLSGWCGPYIDLLYVDEEEGYKFDGYGTELFYDDRAHTLTSYGQDRQRATADDQTYSL